MVIKVPTVPLFVTISCTLLFSAISPSDSWAQTVRAGDDKPHQVSLQNHYVQRDGTKRNRNCLDVYTPKKATNNTPVVIFVHGGAWQFGDKLLVNNKHTWLTKNGIALVSVNYRFHPEANFREQARDIAAAIKWVAKNAERFGIDQNRIFLMGHSAGAHLVALVSTDPSYLSEQQMKPTNLAGVIPMDGGGLNVPYQIEMAESRSNVKTYKTVFSEDAKTQQDASPYHQLEFKRKFPPFFVVHVESRKSTKNQANQFATRLNGIGGTATVVAASNKTHITLNRDLGTDNDPTSRKIIQFIMESGNKVTAAFEKITINKSGGFAGISQTTIVTSDGKKEVRADRHRDGESSELSKTALREINRIISSTNWSKVPEQAAKKNTADDFYYSIEFHTKKRIYKFSYDGMSLEEQKELKRLIQLIGN